MFYNVFEPMVTFFQLKTALCMFKQYVAYEAKWYVFVILEYINIFPTATSKSKPKIWKEHNYYLFCILNKETCASIKNNRNQQQ